MSIEKISKLLEKIHEALKAKNLQDISSHTLSVHQEITGLKIYFKDNSSKIKQELSQIKLIPALSESLIPWMRACYPNPVFYSFESIIDAFELGSAKENLSADIDVLEQILNKDTDALVAILDMPNLQHTLQVVQPVLSRLDWAFGCVITMQSNPKVKNILDTLMVKLAKHHVTSLSIWSVGFNIDLNHKVVSKLRTCSLLMPSEALINFEKSLSLLANLSPQEVYELLCNKPEQLLSYPMDPVSICGLSLEALRYTPLCNQSRYMYLAECHCCNEFSRKSKNFRKYSELRLLDVMNLYHSKNPRLAIVGSGMLFQVAVILAMIAKNTKATELTLDLLDPIAYGHYNFSPVVNSFVNLLIDIGFNLIMQPKASSLCDTTSNRINNNYGILRKNTLDSKPKGTITIEFEQNSNYRCDNLYNKSADIIFMNDLNTYENEIEHIFKAANPGAFYIGANKDFYARGEHKPVTFSFRQKTAMPNEWRELEKVDCYSELSSRPPTLNLSL